MFSAKRWNTAKFNIFSQYSRYCFCGDSYGSYGPAGSDSECNMACSGDSTIKCGGGWRNSVYRISSPAGILQGYTYTNHTNIIAISGL